MLCWKRGLDALAGSVLLISSINCCRNDEGVRRDHGPKSLILADLQPQAKQGSKVGLKAKNGGGNKGLVSKPGTW